MPTQISLRHHFEMFDDGHSLTLDYSSELDDVYLKEKRSVYPLSVIYYPHPHTTTVNESLFRHPQVNTNQITFMVLNCRLNSSVNSSADATNSRTQLAYEECCGDQSNYFGV